MAPGAGAGGLRRDYDRVGSEEWTVGVDSTVVRAHQHAAGALRAPPKDVPEAVLAPTVHTGGESNDKNVVGGPGTC